jgi:hypothetical protein
MQEELIIESDEIDWLSSFDGYLIYHDIVDALIILVDFLVNLNDLSELQF